MSATMEKFLTYLESIEVTKNYWMIAALFVVGIIIRRAFMELTGFSASPALLLLVLFGLYKLRQYRKQRKGTQEQLAAARTGAVHADKKRTAALSAIKGGSRLFPSSGMDKFGAVRSGDSFGGDMPAVDSSKFPGNREWFKTEVPAAHSAAAAALAAASANKKQSTTVKPVTAVSGVDGRDELALAAGAGAGEGAEGDTGAGVGVEESKGARVAAPAAENPFVKITPGGRRVYMGRPKGRLARRKQRRLKTTPLPKRGERGSAPAAPGHLYSDDTHGGGDGDILVTDTVVEELGTGAGAGTGSAALQPAHPMHSTQQPRPVVAAAAAKVARMPAAVGAVAAAGTAPEPKTAPWKSVDELLAELGMEERYAEKFHAEEVDLPLLVGMAQDNAGIRSALKELGVTKLGHREAIAQAVAPFTAKM